MATNFVKASFQEIYDISTKPGSATIIGVHTPTTTRVHGFLHGYFEQYRKFRYDGCSIVAVPMATLPVDPLQVSYEAGEAGIDPRDLLNPILHRCIHGDSLGNSLEKIFNLDIDKQVYDSLDKVDWDPAEYPDVASQVEAMYYAGLVSQQWKKAHVQKGFRRSGIKPMFYQMGTNRQMMPWTDEYLDDHVNEGGHMSIGTAGQISKPVSTLGQVAQDSGESISGAISASILRGGDGEYVLPQFFAGGLRRLGWLDTLQTASRSVTVGDVTTVTPGSWWTVLPKLNMYMMILPPSYKTRMSLRIVIKHYYSFREFRSMRTPLAMETYGAYGYHDLGIDGTPTATANDTLTLLGADAELVTDGVI